MYRMIPLTQGKFAKVSPEDYDELIKYKWCCPKGSRGRVGYAKRTITIKKGKRKDLFMHTAIMQPKEGMFVDHINGDTLDNRRENLRICTAGENDAHRFSFNKNKTGYKGVTVRIFKGVRKQRIYYESRIKYNQKKIYIGQYNTLEEAAAAYNKKAVELFGDFAVLNEIN